jgi:hypothetical protein
MLLHSLHNPTQFKGISIMFSPKFQPQFAAACAALFSAAIFISASVGPAIQNAGSMVA